LSDQSGSGSEIATKADEFAHDYGDLVGVVPYASEVVAAYRHVRQRRVRSFLRGLAGATAGLGPADSERFRAHIRSLPGQELLAEFAETSLRSRTQTATSALALLYADFEGKRFSAAFRSDAVPALEGLTDRTIDAFLLLSRHGTVLFRPPDQGPYPVVAVTGSVVATQPLLSAWSTEASAWFGAVTDLIQRGVLATDWAAGSRIGGEDWMAYFAFSSFSVDMNTLLTDALAALPA
jgi:hypothetical protein